MFLKHQLAGCEDHRTRKEDDAAEIPGRNQDTGREKQGGNTSQFLQPDGTLAVHDMCVFEKLKGTLSLYVSPSVAYANFSFQNYVDFLALMYFNFYI